MISKVKNKFKSEDNKRLLSNFISLLVLQGTNYILPLITFPYLVRVLGVEYFGLLAFASATIAYFNILTDYGFNLTATREISIHRNNKEKVIEIFSSVMTIKIILMFISFFLLSILVFSFEKFSKNALIYFLTFGTVIGQVLFPQWFFQGMEKMKYITFLNILAKSIFTIAIFVFIHQKSDYWKVPLINSLGFITAGIIAVYMIINKFKINFRLQSLKKIKTCFIKGWPIFVSNLLTSIYTVSNKLILGIFTSPLIVGYYAIAEKIINIINSLKSIIFSVLFPYFSKLVQENVYKYNIEFYKFLSLTILFFLLEICIYLLGDNIIYIISGKNLPIANLILKILSFSIVISFLNGYFGTLYFYVNKKEKVVTKILTISGLFYFILIFPIAYKWSYIGISFSFLFIESFILFLYYKNFIKIRKMK